MKPKPLIAWAFLCKTDFASLLQSLHAQVVNARNGVSSGICASRRRLRRLRPLPVEEPLAARRALHPSVQRQAARLNSAANGELDEGQRPVPFQSGATPQETGKECPER